MANLSAYIDFNVRINFSTKELFVSSVALESLPVDVLSLNVTGKVRQPDCIVSSFDVTTLGISPVMNFEGSRSIRLTTTNQPQKGKYSVTLTIKADNYDDTIIEKEFLVVYNRPEVSLVKLFDLLTPQLQIKDQTVYTLPGYTSLLLTRQWFIKAENIGDVVSQDLAIQDLKIGGSYYDAKYSAQLVVNLAYSVLGYDFLRIEDQVNGRLQAASFIIPPFTQFPELLTFIKDNSGGDGDCCESECESPDYKIAFTLFKAIEMHICQADASVLRNIAAFLKIYHKYAGAYVNSGSIIPSYDISFCDAGSGENNYIRNSITEQPFASINISGTARFGNIPNAVGAVSGFLVSVDGLIKHLTEEQIKVLLGSDSINPHTHEIGDVEGLDIALGNRVVKNSPISASTKSKITYDAKGLVTNGENLVVEDIPDLPISKTTGLQEAINGKADSLHTHGISEVTNLQQALSQKALDSQVVHLQGDENIDGLKVFIKSPIVPAPTNANHVANKSYVDSLLGGGAGSNGPDTIELSADGTYALEAGYVIDKILLKPALADLVKIGTAAGSDDIMLEKEMQPGSYGENGVSKDVIAESASITVYFTGITDNTTIKIYKRKL